MRRIKLFNCFSLLFDVFIFLILKRGLIFSSTSSKLGLIFSILINCDVEISSFPYELHVIKKKNLINRIKVLFPSFIFFLYIVFSNSYRFVAFFSTSFVFFMVFLPNIFIFLFFNWNFIDCMMHP